MNENRDYNLKSHFLCSPNTKSLHISMKLVYKFPCETGINPRFELHYLIQYQSQGEDISVVV